MIIEVRAKNVFAFNEQVALSMKADMRNKKFATNVHKENNFNVLKSVGIYGANNTGKTCLLQCIKAIKNVILDEELTFMGNIFTKDPISELGVTFLNDGHKYCFDFKYDNKNKEYVYEKFSELLKDQYDNEKEVVWFLRDSIVGKYVCGSEELCMMMPMISQNNILIHLLDVSKFDKLKEMKEIIQSFANKIDIINMNNIPIKRTIEVMKNKKELKTKIANFVMNADLYMDNFEFVDMDDIPVSIKNNNQAEENVLNVPEQVLDQIRLVSTYKGIKVPSIAFDSTGTKKIAALASYIIEGLEEGRILVVDELDSSIHFKLTRAIVAMFNNELNDFAQLIFTVHDVNLMDCKKLLRKEQIWFVHKDDEGVYVYSLAEFKALDGVRDTTDIVEKYRKGMLGALPEPELIKTLLDISGNKEGECVDE